MVDSVEPDGDRVKVDRRRLDGETDSPTLPAGDTSGGSERAERESSLWLRGDEGEDKSRCDAQPGFDLWTVGGQFCNVELGVLIDVFKVLGVPAGGRADGLLLEGDAAQKTTQTTIRVLVAFSAMRSHSFFIKNRARWGAFHRCRDY